RMVVVVVGQRRRDQRARVADDHTDRPKPSFNNSSLRAAMSVRRPDAAANHGGGHGRSACGATRSRSSATAAGTSSSGNSSTSLRSSSLSALTPTMVERRGPEGSNRDRGSQKTELF